jgi:hypothetical protein
MNFSSFRLKIFLKIEKKKQTKKETVKKIEHISKSLFDIFNDE